MRQWRGSASRARLLLGGTRGFPLVVLALLFVDVLRAARHEQRRVLKRYDLLVGWLVVDFIANLIVGGLAKLGSGFLLEFVRLFGC